ncbi:MAG: alpha/beta hydrolase [Bryobacterales bacterium]
MTVNETDLHVEERGSGKPIVLVHGSASDVRTWQAQSDGLSQGHRVIAFSRRYHWPNGSIPPSADYAMREHVSDLVALLERM